MVRCVALTMCTIFWIRSVAFEAGKGRVKKENGGGNS